jgi:hypothetical protein
MNNKIISILAIIALLLTPYIVMYSSASEEIDKKERNDDKDNTFQNMQENEITINVSKDTQINKRSPNSNAGSSTELQIINTYGDGSDWGIDGMLYFNLSMIEPYSQILSATMYLYYHRWHDTNPAGRIISFYKNLGNWNESNVTWNNAPSFSSVETANGTVPSSTGTWMPVNVTDDVQTFINGSYENYGWRLVDEEKWGDPDIPRSFYRTKEYGSYIPYLFIQYEIGKYPVVETKEATNITETSADINGYLSWDGNESCDVWFEWGHTESLGNETTKIIDIRYETSFKKTIQSLTPGQIYYYRTVAENSNGIRYGENKTFLTKPYEPTNFIAESYNTTQINLTWAKGIGANNTYIERNATGVTSWERGEGIEIYNGTGTYHEDKSLNYVTTYYYQAWSHSEWKYNPTLHQYSNENASTSNTTKESIIVETLNATNITSTNMTLNGNLVFSETDTSTVYFEYSLTPENGTWETQTKWTKMPNPSQLPESGVIELDWSHDGNYLVTGVYLGDHKRYRLYKRNGDTFTRLTLSGQVPDANFYAAEFSPDNNYLAMGYTYTPFVAMYKKTATDTYTYITNALSPAPSGYLCRSISISPDNTYMALGMDQSPHLLIYKRSGDYWNKLSDPANMPTDGVQSLEFSKSGTYLAVGQRNDFGTYKHLWVYKRSGDTFTSLSISSPNDVVEDVTWRNSDTHLAVAGTDVWWYARSGDTFTPSVFDSYIKSKSYSVSFSPDDNWFAVKNNYNSSSHLLIYKKISGNWYRNESPSILPSTTSYARGLMFSPDNEYLAVSSWSSPYILLYKKPPFSMWIPAETTTPKEIAGGNFHENITNLDPGTLYYYRAVAENTFNRSYGEYEAVLTRPEKPIDLTAEEYGGTQINLTWVKGTGSNNTYIERNTTPTWERGQGTVLYNGTGTYHEDKSLNYGTTYYYQAWGYSEWTYNPTLHQWSTDYKSTNCTTNVKIIIETMPATGINSTNATLWGNFTEKVGYNFSIGFEWGNDEAYENTIFISDWEILDYINKTGTYGEIYAIASDDEFIYVGGDTPNTIRKYWVENMSYTEVASSSYGGTIYSIKIDDTHVYVGGSTTNKVRKYLKSDLSFVSETVSYGGTINSISIDNTHIYVAGSTTNRVRKYLKSTMAYVSETSTYGNTIYEIVTDDDYVYAGGDGTIGNRVVKQYWKTNMTLKAQSADYGGSIRSIAVDDLYVYAGGISNQRVKQYWKSNMTLKSESPSYGGIIWSIVVDKLYVYAGGASTRTIRQYRKSDMQYTDLQTENYLGTIRSIELDENFIYAGGLSNQKVSQYHAYPEKKPSQIYNYNMQNLDPGTLYNFRAIAYDNDIVGYGENEIFLTKPEPTQNFTANKSGYDQINVSWIKGEGAIKTYIERNTTSNWERGEGIEIYNGTGTYHEDELLDYGKTYYYQAWSYVNESLLYQYSSSVSTDEYLDPVYLPTVQTLIYEELKEDSVKIRGYLNSDGGASCTVWFEYGKSTPLSTNTSVETNIYSGTYFNYNLSGLDPGNLYYYRAVAENVNGTKYGTTFALITKPYKPTNLQVNAYNSTAINITWTKGTGANNTHIERNSIQSWSRGEGELIYDGENEFYDDVGLDENKTYFYQAWSKSIWMVSTQYSDYYESANETTKHISNVTETFPSHMQKGVPINIGQLNATLLDKDGDTIHWTIETVPNIGSNSGTSNSGENATCSISTMTYGQKYTWYVNLTAGNDYVSLKFNFSANTFPQIYGEMPKNNTRHVDISISLINATIYDADDDYLDWTIETVPNIGSESRTSESSGDKMCSVSGLQYNTTYTWYVNATDRKVWTNKTYYFSTNYFPIISEPNPEHNSIVFPKPVCSINVSDEDGDVVEVKFYENTTGDWVLQKTEYINTSIATHASFNYNNASEGNTYYWWKVIVDDQNDGIVEKVYKFRTNNPMIIYDEEPADNSINVRVETNQLNVTIDNPDGKPFNWTITTSPDIGDASGTLESNGTKVCSISGLQFGTTYEWTVHAEDDEDQNTVIFEFRTASKPEIKLIYPENNSYTKLTPRCSIEIRDMDGGQGILRFYENTTGDWVLQEEKIFEMSNTWKKYNFTFENATTYNTKYWWKVIIIDDLEYYEEKIWSFTPKKELPIVSDIWPQNNSAGVSIYTNQIEFYIEDVEGHAINWTVETYPDIGTSSEMYGINGTKYIGISVLDINTTYTWYLNASSGPDTGEYLNVSFNFKTVQNPIIHSEKPVNNTETNTKTFCSVVVDDPDRDSILVKFYENTTGDWVLQKEEFVYELPKESYWYYYNNATVVGETYWWKVVADNLGGGVVEKIFSFTTDASPIFLNEKPLHGSKGHPTTLNELNVTIENPSGKLFDWTIETVPNIGSNSVSGESNGTKTCFVSGIKPNITYTWYVNATDGVNTSSVIYTFDSTKNPIVIEVVYFQIPIPVKPEIFVVPFDEDEDNVTAKIFENTTGSWVLNHEQVSNYSFENIIWIHNNATEYDTKYWFKVNLSDGKGGYFEEIYNFTTTINFPPRVLNPEPENNSINVHPGTNSIRVTIEDDENLINYTIETSPNVGSVIGENETSGIKLLPIPDNLEFNTEYAWYVNATDGTSWTNKTYTFTTGSSDPVVIENPNPANETSNININEPLLLEIDIYDPDGDEIIWSIETSPDVGTSYGGGEANGTKSCVVYNLQQGITYIWYVNATDGYRDVKKTYQFTTSQPPIIISVYPENNSEGSGISPVCSLTIDDPDALYDQIDVYWYQLKSGTWELKQINENLTELPDTITWKYEEATDPSKVYYWKIVAIDHNGASVNGIFNFRPTYNEPPELHFPSPAQGQTNIDINTPYVSVEIYDRENDNVNWIITTSPNVGTNYSLAYEPGTVYCPLTNLQYGTTYYWSVNTTDELGSGQWTNATFWFTTSFWPEVTNVKPANNARAFIQPICSIDVYDGDGGNLNVKFYENTTGDWVLQKEVDVSAKPKNTVTWHYTNASVFGETYYWRINVSDPEGHYINEIYKFTANRPPIISSPMPANNTINIPRTTALLQAYIEDPEGDPIDWTIQTYPYIGSSFGVGEANGTKNVAVFNLQPGITYTWYVNTTDGVTETKEVYNFRTEFYPEVITTIPQNNEINVKLMPKINVTIFDTDGGNVELRFQENTTGSWVLRYTTSVDATTQTNATWNRYTNAYQYNTWYWWKLIATDDEGNTITRTYKFKTVPNTPPWITNETPSHNSVNIDLSTSILNVDIEDAEGHLMNWTIETYPDIGNSSGNGYSNETISCSISGLVSDKTYRWYVNVSDGFDWSREIFKYNTTRKALIRDPIPENNSVVERSPICSVEIEELDGDLVDVEFYREEGVSWVLMQTNTSVNASAPIRIQWDKFIHANTYSTNYRWKVMVYDEKNSTAEKIFKLRTVDNNHPIIENNNPTHGMIGISVYKNNVSVNVTDIEGHLMNVTISGKYLNNITHENVTNGTYYATHNQRLPYNRKIDWNVKINDGYNWTNATFHFYTEFDLMRPEINNVTADPERAKKNEIIVIEANVTDNDEVDFVEVVFPSLGVRHLMYHKGNDLYGLEIEFTVLGNYLFYIYAEDVWGNSNTSDYYNFTIVAKEIMIDLHTIEYAHKNSENKLFISITDSYYSNQVTGIKNNISCYIANKEGYILMNGTNPEEVGPGLYEKTFNLTNKSGSFIAWILIDYKGSTYMQASVFEIKYFAYENISSMSDRLSDLVRLTYFLGTNSTLEIIEHVHPTNQLTENISEGMEKTEITAKVGKTVMKVVFSWVLTTLVLLAVFIMSTWLYGRKKGKDIAIKVANIPGTIVGYIASGRFKKDKK